MMARMTGRSLEMSKAIGPGERITQARRRNKLLYLIGSLAFGAVLGASLGLLDQRPGNRGFFSFTTMTLDPGVSIAMAILLAIGLVAVPIYMFRKVDELAVQHNLRAMSAGWFAMMAGYPIWQALAAGGWAGQPTALGIFLLGYGITMVTYLVAKWRT